MSRFNHLKQDKTHRSLDEFIEGATHGNPAKIAKKKPNKEELLLIITGQLDRINQCENPKLVYIKKSIANDIKRYCEGNDQVLINYLLRLGIDALKERNELIIETE